MGTQLAGGRTRRAKSGGRGRPRSGATKDDSSAREVGGLALVGLGLFLAASLFLGLSVGPVGAGLETAIRWVVGVGVALAPLVLVAVGLALILRHPTLSSPPLRLGLGVLGTALVVAFAAGTFGIAGADRTQWFDPAVMPERGGYLGELGYFATASTVGDIGTGILVVLGILTGLILVTGASLGLILRRSGDHAATAGRGAARAGRSMSRGVATVTLSALRKSTWITDEVKARVDALEAPTLVALRGGRAAPKDQPLVDGAGAFPDLYDEPDVLPPSPALQDPHLRPEDTLPPEPLDGDQDPGDGEAEGFEPAIAPLMPTAAAAPEAAPMPPVDEADEAVEPGEWRAPPTSLLRRSSGAAEISSDQVRATSEQLEEALGHFGIEAEVANAIGGPRVTRYELRLKPGTKVGRISALRDDLAYALAARDELRIIAPIPGKQAVGVEVPNPEPALVTLGDIYRDFPKDSGPLMAWLGLDIGGKPVHVDLTRMPHLLIAGSTGTGKSVCLNALLASILLRSSPDELKMILIDPKKVELNHYESLPHLVTPVVTRPNDAAAVLANVVREMEARYELMGMARARNLRDWNAARVAQGEKAIPTMLVVIDELADLMMIAPAEVEDSIIRLAQKSRAVGIHLVLATQRPSADVITGMIKANVPSRIAFAVSSQVDSRVILDANGAESLLGQGDMLFRPVGSSRLQRLQGAYVSEEEIRELADAWRDQGRPEIREELLERPEEDPAAEAADEEVDAMLQEAVELVVSQGTASVSMLQRRLGVGYARAGRLVDTLERMGVVSGYEGSKPRRVLVGPGDLSRLLGHPDEEADLDDPDDLPAGDEMPGDLHGSAPLG